WVSASLAEERGYVENVRMMKIRTLAVLLFLLLPALAWPFEEEVRIVVLDPGHGGYERGIRDEKSVTLAVARQIKDILEYADARVYLTRKIDHFLSLSERRAVINSHNPDIFVSLHFSGSDDFAVYVTRYAGRDASTSLKKYYSIDERQRRYLYESGLLAGTLEKALAREYGTGVVHREMPLPLLNAVGAPAVLVELPSRGITYGEREILRVASVIALGIMNYEEKR
ncbi:MAG: N-acetylmuramoyl-L-alanine amidase, partial [Nitrospirota bacterium]